MMSFELWWHQHTTHNYKVWLSLASLAINGWWKKRLKTEGFMGKKTTDSDICLYHSNAMHIQQDVFSTVFTSVFRLRELMRQMLFCCHLLVTAWNYSQTQISSRSELVSYSSPCARVTTGTGSSLHQIIIRLTAACETNSFTLTTTTTTTTLVSFLDTFSWAQVLSCTLTCVK